MEKEKLYDLQNQRKALIDEAKKMALEGKHESEEYREKMDRIRSLAGQIEAVRTAMDLDEPAEEPGWAEKGLRRLAYEPQGDKAGDAVKDFAAAARAGFRAEKAAGDPTYNREGSDPDGGYTVPKDIVYRVEKYREAKASLRGLVSVESVSTLSGRRTFKKRSQQTGFVKVGEGGKIPKKDGPQFEIKNYSVSKYAGFFAVTNELLADSDENITNCLVQWIGDEARVTDNKLILACIDQKAKVDLKDLAGLKKALYLDLDAAFRSTSRIVTNSDGIFWLSNLKDANGRDLLSPIPSEPGRMQLAIGAQVFRVEEINSTDLPSDGTKAPFLVGDLKEGVRLFDRKLLTLTTSNIAVAGDLNAYEQDLTLTRAIERLDVQLWDDSAFINGFIDTAAVPAG